MIVWLNGTHGVGKTTTAQFVQRLIPDSRIFDAEKVGETLMDVRPVLSATDNFQHWPPWRTLVVETASRILEYTGGTLVMPMTVLTESYWREISEGLGAKNIPVHHFVLHADQKTLHHRIANDSDLGPSQFRFDHIAPYSEAFEGWLGQHAHIIESTNLTPDEAATQIADAMRVNSRSAPR